MFSWEQLEPLASHNRGFLGHVKLGILKKPRNRGSAHGASRMLRSSTQGLGNAAGMETMPAVDQPWLASWLPERKVVSTSCEVFGDSDSLTALNLESMPQNGV